MNLEEKLTGENLEFYKNIQDLKVITANAKFLIRKSHTMYKDVIQKHEFARPISGTEQSDDKPSIRSLCECPQCGLQHGAQGVCIVQEIVRAEKIRRSVSPRKSMDLGLHPRGEIAAPKVLPSNKVKKWEDLLYRRMSPKELDAEHIRICNLYGAKFGHKFLLARSMAQKPDKVEPLFEGKVSQKNKDDAKFKSITKHCFPGVKTHLAPPCPGMSPEIRNKMSSVVDVVPPCSFELPEVEKVWRNVFRQKPRIKLVEQQQTVQEEVLSSRCTFSGLSFQSRTSWCGCGLDDCECDDQPSCNPPQKTCQTLTSYNNNYLLTMREKVLRRAADKGKPRDSSYYQINDIRVPSYDFPKKDSELLQKKGQELHEKHLKNCLSSAIKMDDPESDKRFAKITELTEDFIKPDDKAWELWMGRYQAQRGIADEEDLSGDSDIPTSKWASTASLSTTDREIQGPQPEVRHIPFVNESLKLVDILFEKIYARFKKSVKKSATPRMILPYKKLIFSHVSHLISWITPEFSGNEIADKLDLYFLNLKCLKPKWVLKGQWLKRLEAKRKTLSKTNRRRDLIENLQLGKRYRRRKNSAKFTEAEGYKGFNANERNLLQKPSPGRFTTCDLVGDTLLSKERIRHHYRLLRTLFDGPMLVEDRENLMDEGMKGRLKEFKKALRKGSWGQYASDSDTEDEDGGVLKAASVSKRRPSKNDEKKLKSAPTHLPSVRSNQNSGALRSQLNEYGTESSLYNEAYTVNGMTSSFKSFQRIPSMSKSDKPEVASVRLTDGTSGNFHRQMGNYSDETSLMKESYSRGKNNSSQTYRQFTSLNSDQMLPSRRFSQPDSSEENFLVQWEHYRLPSPPYSESICREIDDSLQHRVPPKEEVHMERSARIENGRERGNRARIDESDDGSSDSYVPKLLEVPPKRAPVSPTLNRSLRANRKSIKERARVVPCMSDSSSTDTEPVNPLRHTRRERPAWDHKSGASRNIAPYLGTPTHANNRLPSSVPQKTSVQKGNDLKSTFTSPLPQAGRSILKKNPLPKPPSDATSETQSKTLGVGTKPAKRQSFSEASIRTTSGISGGLVRPACVITERLLKATSGNPENSSSIRKHSSLSRATPDGARSASLKMSGSLKSFVTPSVSEKSGEEADELRKQLSVRIETPKSPELPQPTSSPDETDGEGAGKAELVARSESLNSATSSRRMSRKASKIAREVFRRRSLVSPDSLKQHQTKTGKNAVQDAITVVNSTDSIMTAKLKKLQAVGPTKKRCFDLDIGQGINCVNYLKENAPGADEMKKKELVDLLVTPVEIKKPQKKAVPKANEEISLASVVTEPISQEYSSDIVRPSMSSKKVIQDETFKYDTPLTKTNFKTLDQIYKEVHGINKHNTPWRLVENDYEYEAKKRQQLTKHKIVP